jgi:hypothetical protein
MKKRTGSVIGAAHQPKTVVRGLAKYGSRSWFSADLLRETFGLMRGIAAFDKRLDAFFKFAPRQEHAPLARLTHDADVRAQTHDLPFKSAAGVRFAQSHDVSHKNFERHDGGNYSMIQVNR